MSQLIGIILGALGSVCINTGNNMQSLGMAQLEIKANEDAAEEEAESLKNGTKKSVKVDDELDPAEEIDTCKSPVWVAGTFIFVTGSLLNFVAFAFAPQSILASLEGIQFVTNVIFGRCILGSHITPMMYGGTFMTIIGVVVTVLSASVVGTLEATVHDMLILWTNPIWLAYLVGCCIGGFFLHTTHMAYEKAALAGKPYANSDYVLPITYAMFSALFGTFSVVLAKMLSEIVTLQLEFGVNIFYGEDCWFTYVTLVAWLIFAGIWLYRMNEALGLYDPLFIIPLLQVNFILFAIISGGIYFKEFSYFKTINVIGFCIGVFLLVFGIFLLSPVIVIDEEEDLHDLVQKEDSMGNDSFASAPGSSPALARPSRRLSFTKMSINGRDMEGNVRTPGSNKRGSLATFKFGAVAGMNDMQHDLRVNKAIMSDKNVDESWKQDRVSNRRRLSAIPMGASRIVAVQDTEEVGSATQQMAVRRQTRRSISSAQPFMGSIAEQGMASTSSNNTSNDKSEGDDEDDDWETDRKKKAALMELDKEKDDESNLLDKANGTSSPKPGMEPLEQEAAEETQAVSPPEPPTKTTKNSEPEQPQSLMDSFTSVKLPEVSFTLPTMSMPWDTPDVKDTSTHTAL